MRSTSAIIVAVKECQPATEEELRMALMALSGVEYFSHSKLRSLARAVRGGNKTIIEIQTLEAERWETGRIEAERQDPLVWLGPNWIPGTPENLAQMKLHKSIFEAATGIDLDSQVGD